MTLKDFACLLVDSPRAKAYVQKLVAHSLMPAMAIYVDRSGAHRGERGRTDGEGRYSMASRSVGGSQRRENRGDQRRAVGA